MKKKLLVLMAVASITAAGLNLGIAQNAPASELRAVITKIQKKIRDARAAEEPKKLTEADLAPEIKELDELFAKQKSSKPDEAAQILHTKSTIYSQLLDNEAKGEELLTQLKNEFPNSKIAEAIKKSEAAKKIQESLVVGSKFPDFDEKDINGKPLSIANYKGKVVLIDFWATWCGPCVAELPHVLEAYEKHHDKGFEIIGISLDQSEEKLNKFIKDKNMPWQQFFDGQGWNNKLSSKYGIQSIPATYLLDGNGVIIGKNLRGKKLEEAVAAALKKS